MTAWQQAVFVRQQRTVEIQRALTQILDAESWSPAIPRRLHVGSARTSAHGWTCIVSPLADFFLDADAGAPRVARLAEALGCAAFALDVRSSDVTLVEADGRGAVRTSRSAPARNTERNALGFGLLADQLSDAEGGATLADRLGARAGFPAWTSARDDDGAGALYYEPPVASASVRARPETRAATARATPRAARPVSDRTGRRPRSAARPRR